MRPTSTSHATDPSLFIMTQSHHETTSSDAYQKGSDSTAATGSSTTALTANGADLRHALEEAQSRDATAKAALAKSDAVILELRGNVRSLKKQVEQLNTEKQQSDAMVSKYRTEVDRLQTSAELSRQQDTESKSQLATSESASSQQAAIVGELQVQLDRAHAQILTSDMVRKELEDTLEAEQYTWELRVQDQERTISTLQQECRTLREDLEQCRAQWREAEDGWTRELQELQTQMQNKTPTPTAAGTNGNAQELQARLELLEQEREELQSCLDEAMQELEAVDQELRASPVTNAVEPLLHLYTWLLERSEQDVTEPWPNTPEDLVDAIQAHIESIPSANLISNTDAALKVAELEAEISVFRGDIQARDESNAELRSSLKEAVSLLKPLQDAVNKSEQEKEALQAQLDELEKTTTPPSRQDLTPELEKRDREIESLQKEIASLTEDLIQVKRASPERTSRSLQAASEEGTEQAKLNDRELSSSPSSLQKARDDLRAKRESERALQQMLRNAQGRFHALHQENHDVEAQNHALRDRIQELEDELEQLELNHEEMVSRNVAAEMREATVSQLEQETKGYQEELQRKEDAVIRLEEELALAKDKIPKLEKETKQMKAELEELRDAKDRIEEIESELSAARGDLEAHKEAETVLAKSLKQAVGLLRPLETHLENAEQEKREIHRELKVCRKKLAKLEAADSESRSRALSLPNEVEMHDRDLGGTVRELEQENDKIQNALGEVSQNRSLNEGGENDRSQVRLKENLVELNSRYEVTQNKLERAVVENHALIDALKHKEKDERKVEAELRDLREELMRSNRELENAKYIATSALVKVEELTMQTVAQMSLPREGEPLRLGQDYAHMSPPEKTYMLERVRTIEKEVEHASRAPKSLEGSLEDRERIVQSLTSTPQSSGEMATAPPQPAVHERRSRPLSVQREIPRPTSHRQSPATQGSRRPRRPSELPPWASPDDYD